MLSKEPSEAISELMLVEKKILNLKTSIGILNALSKTFGKKLASNQNAEIFFEVITEISSHNLSELKEIRGLVGKLKGTNI